MSAERHRVDSLSKLETGLPKPSLTQRAAPDHLLPRRRQCCVDASPQNGRRCERERSEPWQRSCQLPNRGPALSPGILRVSRPAETEAHVIYEVERCEDQKHSHWAIGRGTIDAKPEH
jgi:hypothetical protein